MKYMEIDEILTEIEGKMILFKRGERVKVRVKDIENMRETSFLQFEGVISNIRIRPDLNSYVIFFSDDKVGLIPMGKVNFALADRVNYENWNGELNG